MWRIYFAKRGNVKEKRLFFYTRRVGLGGGSKGRVGMGGACQEPISGVDLRIYREGG